MKAESSLFRKLSGDLGKVANVRTRKDGSLDISSPRGPGYARTEDQNQNREAFWFVKEDWKQLSAEQKAEYEERGKESQITGYNQYLKEKLGDEIEGGGWFRFGVSWFGYGRFS